MGLVPNNNIVLISCYIAEVWYKNLKKTVLMKVVNEWGWCEVRMKECMCCPCSCPS